MQRSISIYDLMEIPEAAEVIRNGDSEGFKKILHYLGFDVEKEVTESEYYHRPMFTGTEVKFGKLFHAHERQDDEWVKSKACSLDNRIKLISETDDELADELIKMSEYPNFSDLTERHLRGEADVFEQEFYNM